MFFLLFLAAVAGGALNSVAGGGSFICLPALMFAGVPARGGERHDDHGDVARLDLERVGVSARHRRGRSSAACSSAASASSAACSGGYLLVRTSDTSFLRLLPWLMLVAAITFTFGGRLASRFRGERRRLARSATVRCRCGRSRCSSRSRPTAATSAAASGIMMLAALSVAGITDIHEMNGLKAVLAVVINGVALVEFVAHGVIAWAPGLIMVAGGILGGYFGASFARRLPQASVRALRDRRRLDDDGLFLFRAVTIGR